MIVLPAAAECTSSVWFPEVVLFGLDLQLVALNVTGSLLEGFFAAWDTGVVRRPGMLGALLPWIASDVRGSFLSTYTSWAGMIAVAAAMASRGSLLTGLLYILGSVACGLVGNAAGEAAARSLAGDGTRRGEAAEPPGLPAARYALLAALLAYIAATLAAVRADAAITFHDADAGRDEDLPALRAWLDRDEARLLVAMGFSVLGAAAGNALAGLADARRRRPHADHLCGGPGQPSRAAHGGSRRRRRPRRDDGPSVGGRRRAPLPAAPAAGAGTPPPTVDLPRGTLICNSLFALLGLALNACALRRRRWVRSVPLQAFSQSFCGAASAFAGHTNDTRELWARAGPSRAMHNLAANLGGAVVVFLVAVELERMLGSAAAIDQNADGVVDLWEVAAHYGFTLYTTV